MTNRADLEVGAVLRWTRGTHAGLLTEIRKANGHSLELRILPGQRSRIGSGSDKTTRYTMGLDYTALATELVRPKKVKHPMSTFTRFATVREAQASVALDGQTQSIESADPPLTTPRHYISGTEWAEAFTTLGLSDDDLRAGIRAWGVDGLADKLGLTDRKPLRAILERKALLPGRGAPLPTGGASELAARFGPLRGVWRERAAELAAQRRASGAKFDRRNGPVTVRKEPTVIPTVIPTPEATVTPPVLGSHIELLEEEITTRRTRIVELRAQINTAEADIHKLEQAVDVLKTIR